MKEKLNALLQAKEQTNEEDQNQYESSPERMDGESPSARAMYKHHSQDQEMEAGADERV